MSDNDGIQIIEPDFSNISPDLFKRMQIPELSASTFQLMYAVNQVHILFARAFLVRSEHNGTETIVSKNQAVADIQMDVHSLKDLHLLINGFIKYYETENGEIVTQNMKERSSSAGN